jgi:hypothetical protein
MMWALNVSRSTTAAASRGVGEGGAPFGERRVGRVRDGCLPFAAGDDLEQQLGSARVEADVADLCRHRDYAEHAEVLFSTP